MDTLGSHPAAVMPAPPTQESTFRCMGCRARFRHALPVQVSMAAWAAAAQAIRCPRCGDGSKRISFSEGRTLREDAGERGHGNEGDRAAHWLRTGEAGESSLAIHAAMTGSAPAGPAPHPLDMDDFRRCALLLRHVPEWRGRLGEMAALSPQWSGLAAAWEAIESKALLESPNLDCACPMAAALLADAIA